MMYSFELVLVALVLATAFAAIHVKDLISAVFILGGTVSFSRWCGPGWARSTWRLSKPWSAPASARFCCC